MPGVQVLLPRLVSAGVLLGIVSGALEAAAHVKLARGGLTGFFSFGGYGSDSRDRGELTRRAIDRADQICGHAVDSREVLGSPVPALAEREHHPFDANGTVLRVENVPDDDEARAQGDRFDEKGRQVEDDDD